MVRRTIIFAILLFFDMMQTVFIARNPEKFHEHNVFLGLHPSPEAVYFYFSICMILFVIFSRIMPEVWEIKKNGSPYWRIPGRTIFQWIFILIEFWCVLNNNSVGIKVSF